MENNTLTTEQKNMLIYANPVDAYKKFIVNKQLDETHHMLSKTAENALCIESGTYKSKYAIIASQQALFMMLHLNII